jgi:hypothetical protein
MDETPTIYWKHISRNYLNPGYKRDLFTKPVPNLKQKGKNKKEKTKNLLRVQKWGVGEKWKEELRDSKPRIPGVKCGCSCSTSHYVEE